ncbi:MAG: DUF4177 domain-containing protein [Dokdonella sp.]|uniref:DUF4177 domain-containing protein n=1 Tax=Dokdonella sp. TaxID=2291710 RepID=UPI002CEAACD0|nr:DUF4177 domain-containing protein [Dokdonella sp.]HOX71255.1 DUF4177 domain-containing protein [Dokdonella sp.]HPG95163.1 DUF4177 domain-containing protein [Dokdonella sp.]HPN79601.1 DUF4177 domain-containing protein [Dokdonella sp.]
MNEQTWSYQTIEVRPSFLGSFDIENINEVLTREGLMGWELVSTLNVGPMRPILLFLKKKC